MPRPQRWLAPCLRPAAAQASHSSSSSAAAAAAAWLYDCKLYHNLLRADDRSSSTVYIIICASWHLLVAGPIVALLRVRCGGEGGRACAASRLHDA